MAARMAAVGVILLRAMIDTMNEVPPRHKALSSREQDGTENHIRSRLAYDFSGHEAVVSGGLVGAAVASALVVRRQP